MCVKNVCIGVCIYKNICVHMKGLMTSVGTNPYKRALGYQCSFFFFFFLPDSLTRKAWTQTQALVLIPINGLLGINAFFFFFFFAFHRHTYMNKYIHTYAYIYTRIHTYALTKKQLAGQGRETGKERQRERNIPGLIQKERNRQTERKRGRNTLRIK